MKQEDYPWLIEYCFMHATGLYTHWIERKTGNFEECVAEAKALDRLGFSVRLRHRPTRHTLPFELL